MSSIRQGVLRAVRLLPDVVKIGLEAETALSSPEEEEQLFNGAPASADVAEAGPVVDPEKEWADRVARLEQALAGAEADKAQLTDKKAALEGTLEQVRTDAERRVRAVEAEVAQAKEEARQEGRTQGHAEGLDAGYQAGVDKARAEVNLQYKERFAALVALLEQIASRLEADFAELASLNQPRMLRLWQEMLKKMLQRESVLAPDAVLGVLSDVLSRLSDKNQVLIYVSPEDVDLVQDRMQGDFQEILRGVKHLELKPDMNVDRGSCIVETNLGVYDARWRTQFEQINVVLEKLFQKLGKPLKGKAVRTRKKKADGETELPEKPEKAAAPKKKKTDSVNASD